MMDRTTRRPKDANQLAKLVVDIATKEACDQHEQKSRHISAAARIGGKLGGAARATALSPERKKEIATLAAKKRWAKND
jgi:hypothetical protein